MAHVPRIRERGGHNPDGSPRRHVLCALRDHGPQPRVVLARRLDLSPTTVTKVVTRLIDEGFVTESGVEGRGSRVGRPPTHVALVPTAAYVLGVQVGVGTVHIGLCDLLGRPRHATRFPFDAAAGPPSLLGSLAGHANRLVSAAGFGSADILAAGVAAPGPVDRHRRRNLVALNLGWRDVAGVGDPTEPSLVRLATGVERGDPRAIAAADDLVEHLGTGLACAVNLLNPRLLVLGGIFDDAPDLIVDRVRTAVHRKAFPILRDNLRVDRSALGAAAGVAGGAALALDKYFYA